METCTLRRRDLRALAPLPHRCYHRRHPPCQIAAARIVLTAEVLDGMEAIHGSYAYPCP